jgi:hypothetical protein
MKPRFFAAIAFLVLAAATIAFLATAGTARAQDEETRKHMLHMLGGPFIISRDKVQEELKLSGDQKQKLRETMTGHIQATMEVVQKLKELTAGEREKEMQSHRREAGEGFSASLKEILTADQLKRLRQLQLQHDGPGALGRPEVRQELNITDGQLRQFMGVIAEMQKQIEPLMKEAQSGGNPQEIRPKVIKIRKEHEAKLEALLSAAQRKQWKDMLGKPVDVLDD